ncbi:RNA polymerase II-associated protein 3 isoform X2 [Pleuronectes platessa]|uniref:RNA polymerase II-associated protein 3 isoform X2 n=1 Tax=Pleuronectes platessa TaxID=8262 RepID=UPI00232A30F1|nr:RNA polymerase II-associated protein 3 isoform X2 [Pleuronectes platessa]
MAERKDQSKGAAHASTDDVKASMLQEAMADFLKSKMVRIQGADHFMQILSTGVFNETKPFFPEEDLSYSDISDYDDDDEDDYFKKQKAAHQPKEPHSQTAKSTDKDDKDEMKAEEEQSKEKRQKNKRKKMRRKEKKQSEKENTGILPEEEPGKSDSSEIQEENPSTNNNTEANKSPERVKTLNETEAAGDEKRSVVNNREENLATINKNEEVDQEEEKELDSNKSYAVKSMPEETCNQKPSQEIQENQLVEVLQPEKEGPKVEEEDPKVVEEKPKVVEEEPKVVEDPEVQKERRLKPNEEQLQKENVQQKTTPTAAEEYANISRDLAGKGNRLAASGMFEHAIECFTDAIKFNPREYRLFGNRSLCYERMQHFENALRDADLSLSMEPNWIKGLFRKGKALCGLKRYYEASLVYEEVLQLDRSSAEAKQELKRAQTLHLMEMGFGWAKCNEALKHHATLQEATEALFAAHDASQGAGASRDDADERVLQAEDGKESKAVPSASPSRAQPVKVPLTSSPLQSRSQSHSPTPRPRNSVKPQLYSIWVGALAPTVTYASLHELFSRVGVIYSIKIMLEHECAFVNYTRLEDCERAIQCFDGMVLEGIVLHVRYSVKGQSGCSLGKKECFFWRTTGCTRQDCTFKHVPEHKKIDSKKFTSRLGFNNM